MKVIIGAAAAAIVLGCSGDKKAEKLSASPAQDTARWVVLRESRDSADLTSALDRTRVDTMTGWYTVWMRNILAKPSDSGGQPWDKMDQKEDIRCSPMGERLHESVQYLRDSLIQTIPSTDTAWSSPVPESRGEAIMKSACEKLPGLLHEKRSRPG